MKDSEKVFWDPMKNPAGNNRIAAFNSPSRASSKLLLYLIFLLSFTYFIYSLKLLSSSRPCSDLQSFSASSSATATAIHSLLNLTADDAISLPPPLQTLPTTNQTEIQHIVFGIAASAKLWKQRKEYIKLWFKPEEMRGTVWLDRKVKTDEDSNDLPPIRISGDTSKFAYKNKQGHRSAIRISRIVSETFRLGLKDVRWFVMGDDDTVFVTENLVRVLRKYDHTQFHYIGSLSESHLQNIYFSYSMAYGGGGFAISYPLAKALVKMQDRCIQRYPGLYGSDDRMQACMAELGVPLSKELGFHQYDVYGNLFGLLAAHPIAPFVSLHHLDIVEPIFPNVTRLQALQRLAIPMKLDSAGLMQQSICYHKSNAWTISVSWGFAVQIFRGILSPREVEMPARTFLNWYRRADYKAYAFNTRPVSRNPCQKAFVFYLSNAAAQMNSTTGQTVSKYTRHRVAQPACKWKSPSPGRIDIVKVVKKADPKLWDRSPRRNCCRVMKSKEKKTMMVEVGICREGEISEV
ncbi:uncharacterized protein LOC111435745 [Cucurbita moschata]|uniref:Uncharacterized protein LOC111435745 n=1 Tax=Cucurbita moschata TaxID=3662 RepID=A0A6J1ELL2_CUCMO|nr:uncharacterized protein LOC111435745 [Cucurbita moschata]